ncbi:MAG: hypothetical protein AB7K09_15170 [Planctomycetota bacterium]
MADTPSLKPEVTVKRLAWIIFGGMALLLAIYTLVIGLAFNWDWSRSGTFGDTFGFMGAMFAGFAFIAAVLSLFVQRADLVESRKALQATAAAQAEMAEIQLVATLVSIQQIRSSVFLEQWRLRESSRGGEEAADALNKILSFVDVFTGDHLARLTEKGMLKAEIAELAAVGDAIRTSLGVSSQQLLRAAAATDDGRFAWQRSIGHSGLLVGSDHSRLTPSAETTLESALSELLALRLIREVNKPSTGSRIFNVTEHGIRLAGTLPVSEVAPFWKFPSEAPANDRQGNDADNPAPPPDGGK